MPHRLLCRPAAGEADVRDRGRAERAAGVTRRGLYEHALEQSRPDEPRDGDAVERPAAGETEVLAVHLLAQPCRLLEQHLLEDDLRASGHVLGELRQLRLGLAQRLPEEVAERIRIHALAAEEIEVAEIQAEAAALVDFEQLTHLLDVARLAIRG